MGRTTGVCVSLTVCFLLAAAVLPWEVSAHGHDGHDHGPRPTTLPFVKLHNPELYDCVASHARRFGRMRMNHPRVVSDSLKVCQFMGGGPLSFLSEDEHAHLKTSSLKECADLQDKNCEEGEWCFFADLRAEKGVCVRRHGGQCTTTSDCNGLVKEDGERATCEKDSDIEIGYCAMNSPATTFFDMRLKLTATDNVDAKAPELNEVREVEPMSAEEAAMYPPSTTTRDQHDCGTVHTHASAAEWDALPKKNGEKQSLRAKAWKAGMPDFAELSSNAGEVWAMCGNSMEGDVVMCDNPKQRDLYKYDPAHRNGQVLEARMAFHFAVPDGQHAQAWAEYYYKLAGGQLYTLNQDFAKLGIRFKGQVYTYIDRTLFNIETAERREDDAYCRYCARSDPPSYCSQLSCCQPGNLGCMSFDMYVERIRGAARTFSPSPNFEAHFNVFPTKYVTKTTLGYAFFPWDADGKQGIVSVQTDYFNVGQRTLTHELGHSFGLMHTFAGIEEVEACNACKETTASDVNGDFCDDTNPAPKFFACDESTINSAKNTVSCGARLSTLVKSDYTNFMSYVSDQCMDTFTEDQSGRARCYLSTNQVLRRFLVSQPTAGLSPPKNTCESTKCLNGGTVNKDDCSCKCTAEYEGRSCEQAKCQLHCKNGGQLDMAKCRCSCPNGTFGVDCGQQLTTYTPAVSTYKPRTVAYSPSVGKQVTQWGMSVYSQGCMSGAGFSKFTQIMVTPQEITRFGTPPVYCMYRCRSTNANFKYYALDLAGVLCDCSESLPSDLALVADEECNTTCDDGYLCGSHHPGSAYAVRAVYSMTAPAGGSNARTAARTVGGGDEASPLTEPIAQPGGAGGPTGEAPGEIPPTLGNTGAKTGVEPAGETSVEEPGSEPASVAGTALRLRPADETPASQIGEDVTMAGNNHRASVRMNNIDDESDMKEKATKAAALKASESGGKSANKQPGLMKKAEKIPKLPVSKLDEQVPGADEVWWNSPSANGNSATTDFASTPPQPPTAAAAPPTPTAAPVVPATPAASEPAPEASPTPAAAAPSDPPVSAPTAEQQQGPSTFVAQAGDANKTLKMGQRVVTNSGVVMSEDAGNTAAAPAAAPSSDPPVSAPTAEQQEGPSSFVAQAGDANKTLKMGQRVVTRSGVTLDEQVSLDEDSHPNFNATDRLMWPGISGGADCNHHSDCNADGAGNDIHTGEPRARCVKGKCTCAYWVAGDRCDKPCWRGLQDFGATRMLSPNAYSSVLAKGFADFGGNGGIRRGLGCSGNGVCRATYGDETLGYCKCNEGYHGDACQLPHSADWQDRFPMEGTVFEPSVSSAEEPPTQVQCDKTIGGNCAIMNPTRG